MSRIPAVIAGVAVLSSMSAMGAQVTRPTTEKVRPTNMTLTQAVEFVRPSVVQISAEIEPTPTSNGSMQTPGPTVIIPLGAGFMVNEDGYIVTARHVVEWLKTIQNGGRKRLLIGLALPNLENSTLQIRAMGNFSNTECEVVDEDGRHDLALLRMKQNPFKVEMRAFIRVPGQPIEYRYRAAELSPSRPQDGEAIGVSGYPLRSPVLITTSGNLASSWAYDTEEVQEPGAPAWFRRPDTADSYLADMHINPGNSGGPVYSVLTGKVIGVCVGFDLAPVIYGDGMKEQVKVGPRPLAYNSGLAVVVPVRYVIDLLKKHNLKWVETPH